MIARFIQKSAFTMDKPKKSAKAIKKIQVKRAKLRDLDPGQTSARVKGGQYKLCSPAPN